MAARLTDKQKKKIIADYVEIGSYNAVGKLNGVADTTVKRIVNADAETQRNIEVKKEQNSQDILAYMETKRDKVNEIIGTYLDKLLEPEMIAKATPSQLTTALGTLIDKFTMINARGSDEDREDDPLSKALMEEAERMQNADID
jgi:hypothetical protein